MLAPSLTAEAELGAGMEVWGEKIELKVDVEVDEDRDAAEGGAGVEGVESEAGRCTDEVDEGEVLR